MPFTATVLRVFIGSPSDCQEEREMVPAILEEWNRLHAADFGVMLLPMTWEVDSYPSMGGRPQGFINQQIVAPSDFMIAIFRDRLGSSTGEAASGTVEEINQFQAANKKVLLYFKKQTTPLADDQARALADYKKSIQSSSLYAEYEISRLKETMLRHLLHAVRALDHKLPEAAADAGVNAQHEVARRLAGIIYRPQFLWRLWKATGEIPDMEELQSVFQYALNPLIHLRSTLESAIPAEHLPTFDSIIQAGQGLMTLSQTGSKDEVWEKGVGLFDRLESLRQKLDKPPTAIVLSEKAEELLQEIDAHSNNERGITLFYSSDFGAGMGHYLPWMYSVFNVNVPSSVNIVRLSPIQRGVDELESKGFLILEGDEPGVKTYYRTGKSRQD